MGYPTQRRLLIAGKRAAEDSADGAASPKGARTGEEAPAGHGDEVFNPQLLQMYYCECGFWQRQQHYQCQITCALEFLRSKILPV